MKQTLFLKPIFLLLCLSPAALLADPGGAVVSCDESHVSYTNGGSFFGKAASGALKVEPNPQDNYSIVAVANPDSGVGLSGNGDITFIQQKPGACSFNTNDKLNFVAQGYLGLDVWFEIDPTNNLATLFTVDSSGFVYKSQKSLNTHVFGQPVNFPAPNPPMPVNFNYFLSYVSQGVPLDVRNAKFGHFDGDSALDVILVNHKNSMTSEIILVRNFENAQGSPVSPISHWRRDDSHLALSSGTQPDGLGGALPVASKVGYERNQIAYLKDTAAPGSGLLVFGAPQGGVPQGLPHSTQGAKGLGCIVALEPFTGTPLPFAFVCRTENGAFNSGPSPASVTTGARTWVETTEPDGSFGHAVASVGNIEHSASYEEVVVTEPTNDEDGLNTGAAYVFGAMGISGLFTDISSLESHGIVKNGFYGEKAAAHPPEVGSSANLASLSIGSPEATTHLVLDALVGLMKVPASGRVDTYQLGGTGPSLVYQPEGTVLGGIHNGKTGLHLEALNDVNFDSSDSDYFFGIPSTSNQTAMHAGVVSQMGTGNSVTTEAAGCLPPNYPNGTTVQLQPNMHIYEEDSNGVRLPTGIGEQGKQFVISFSDVPPGSLVFLIFGADLSQPIPPMAFPGVPTYCTGHLLSTLPLPILSFVANANGVATLSIPSVQAYGLFSAPTSVAISALALLPPAGSYSGFSVTPIGTYLVNMG